MSSSTSACTLAFKAAGYLDLNNRTVLSPTPFFLLALAFLFSATYFPIVAHSSVVNVDVCFLFLPIDLASVSLSSALSTALFASVVACIDGPLSLGVGSALASLKYLQRFILGAYDETCSIQNLKMLFVSGFIILQFTKDQNTGSSCI